MDSFGSIDDGLFATTHTRTLHGTNNECTPPPTHTHTHTHTRRRVCDLCEFHVAKSVKKVKMNRPEFNTGFVVVVLGWWRWC